MTKKAAEAINPTVKEFLKWLDTSPYLQHLSWYSRFRAIIELWFAAATRNDPVYLERVKELSPDAVRNGACEHFAKLWQAMMAEPQDLLGEAYQAYSVRDTKRLAQYFTPDCVAKCMAQMSVADIAPDVFDKDGYFRIAEPACGSGVMVIHALEAIRTTHGEDKLAKTELVCCDLDPLCVKMTGIQLFWHPTKAASVYLLEGDSLAGNQTAVAHWKW